MNNEYQFDEAFERKLLAFLIRDKAFYEKMKPFVEERYFRDDRFCKDIFRLSKEYIEAYKEPIPEPALRQKLDEMYRKQRKDNMKIDVYFDVVTKLYQEDLTNGREFTEDKVTRWAKEMEMWEVLNKGKDLLIAHKPLDPLLKDVSKVLEIGLQNENFLNEEEFMSLEIEERKIIVHPWLTEKSIGMVAGWRGAGKTWFFVTLLDAITRDLIFCPWETRTPVPCLYVDGELAADELQERFRLLPDRLKPRKAPLYIYNDDLMKQRGFPKASLLNPDWRNQMKGMIIKTGIKVAVFDNLSALSDGANPYDENTKKDWQPINTWLLDLKHSGCASILGHHTGNSATQRGTTGREDNMTYSILLKQPEGYRANMGCKFTLHFKKSRVNHKDLSLIQPYDFQLVPEDGVMHWEWSGHQRNQRLEILKMLDAGIKGPEIAKAFGITKQAVSQTKARAIAHREMTEDGKLTELGKEKVATSVDLIEDEFCEE